MAASSAVQFLDQKSYVITPSSWLLLGALVVWRGRIRQNWSNIGLDEELFDLFVKKKGAPTRIEILEHLVNGNKDRFQLSHELNLAWRAVDRHINIMVAHGLLRERVAYGRVRFFGITPLGQLLLDNVREVSNGTLRRSN